MAHSPDVPSFSVRGIDVAAIDLLRASQLISVRAAVSRGDYVTVTGAHGLVESSDDDLVRRAHQDAFLVVPDGMPLVWLGRRLGFRTIGRVYGPDLVETIFSNSECRELRHFFYGGRPEVVSKLIGALATRFGPINVVGTYSPPMNPVGFREEDAIIRRIREFSTPDHLGRAIHPETGGMAAHAHAQDRHRGWNWRRCRVRLCLRDNSAGSAVDATFGARMAVSRRE